MRMTMWSENSQFWDNLDHLIQTSWLPLKEFIDVAKEHEDEFTLQTNALLFGGLGTFVRTYARMRSDMNDHQTSFHSALIAVHSDHRMRMMIGEATNMMVDQTIDRMKEGNE